jgi:hypothetical protein
MVMTNMSLLASTLSASLALEQKLVAELPQVLPNQTFVVGAVTLTCTEAVAQVEQHLTAEEQLASLKSQLRAAQTNIKGVRAQTGQTLKSIKATAAAVLGTTNPKYETLGFLAPKLRKVATAAEKALTAMRNAATRVARGTKGPVAKAKIHGVVPAPSPATPAIAK